MEEWDLLMGNVKREELDPPLRYLLEKFIAMYVEEKRDKELHMSLLKNTMAFMDRMKEQVSSHQSYIRRLEEDNVKLKQDLDLYRRNNRTSAEEERAQ